MKFKLDPLSSSGASIIPPVASVITGVSASGGTTSPLTTKGDLYTYSTVDDRLPVGADGYILSADSTALTGLKWIVAGGTGTVTSVTSANSDASVANTTTTPVITVNSAPKLTTARNIDGQSFDGSANITVIAPGTHAATSKTTPVDADEVPLVDSAASNILKKLTWANLKATLKTYFDSLYPSGSGTSTGTNTGDQTIALTGDVTGSGTGSFATTIKSNVGLSGSPTTTTQTPADNSTKVATTAYVDNAVLGQNFKEAVGVATTANLVGVYLNGSSGVGATFTYTATGVDTIDGVTLTLGMRVLLKNQTTDFQNGIYTVTTAGAIGIAGILTRATDGDQSTDWKTGDSVFVTAGTTQSTTTWAYTGIDSPTMGTTSITFSQTAGQGSFTAGNGIGITGNSIAIDTSVTVDKTTAQTLTNKTLTAPALGIATATSINKVAITAPASSATLTIANGKTLTTDNSLELAGTDSTVMTFPSTSQTVVGTTATQTLTNKDLSSTTNTFPTGSLVQVVNTLSATVATGSTALPADNSIPQITEGTEFMTLAITPKSATNILVIEVLAMLANTTAVNNLVGALFQDSTANALAAAEIREAALDAPMMLPLRYIMAAGTTSATTFRFRAGLGSTTNVMTFNGSAGTVRYGTIPKSSIIIWEYKA